MVRAFTHALVVLVITIAMMASPLMAATDALAQATPLTSVFSAPFGPIVVVSTCTGDAVTISGTEHSLIHATFDPTGGGHFRFHTGQHGSGVGAPSGKQYTFADTSSFEGNFPGTNYEFTMQMSSRLVTPGPGNNQVLYSSVHVTFNSSGNFSATPENFRAECQ